MEQTSKQIADEHRAASRRAMKKILRSKATATAALVRAGILTKDGKRLAKPYR
jgi:hypothetical protein